MSNEEPGNLERQARNHWPSILAIAAVVVLVVLGWYWLGADSATGPQTAPVAPTQQSAPAEEPTAPAGTTTTPAEPAN